MSEALLAGYPVIVPVRVAWGEMDAFNHVNNVAYFRYLETGRIAYLQRIDWLTDFPSMKIGPIVASVEARFRRPVTFPDTLHVGTRVASLSADRFVVEQVIVSEKLAAVATEGRGVVVSYDYVNKAKAPLPAVFRERIEVLEGGRLSASDLHNSGPPS